MKYRDDNHCIDAVLNGDRSAFVELVGRYKNMVFSIALKIVHSREDAEEVAQDVFVKAYQSLGSFERKSKFSTWLYRITYNAAVTKIRRKKPEFVAIDDRLIANYSEDEIREYAGQLDQDERKLLIDRALKRIPEEDNLLVTLFYKSENSVEEISAIMGLSATNVKVRLHRIRKKLFAAISESMKCPVAV